MRLSLLVLFVAILALSPATVTGAGTARFSNAVGHDVDLGALPSPHPRPAMLAGVTDSAVPLVVRVRVPWPVVEKRPGSYDWTVLDRLVSGYAGAGYEMLLEPYGSLTRTGGNSDEAFEDFLAALASRYGKQVDHYLLGSGLAEADVRDAAFRFKLWSTRVQSADPDALIALILEQSPGESAARLAALYEEGVGVYSDAVALTDVDAGSMQEFDSVKREVLLSDPSSRIWFMGVTLQGGMGNAGVLLRSYIEGIDSEIALVTYTLDFTTEGEPALAPVLESIRNRFTSSMTPIVSSGRGINFRTSMGEAVEVTTLQLYDSDTKKVLIVYDGGVEAERGSQLVMEIDTADFASPFLHDVAAGESVAAGAYQKDPSTGITRVALPIADYPLVLEFTRFTSPFHGEEALEVTSDRIPTVEEILAAHQAFQAAQDNLLVNLRADARVDYHFRIGESDTLDVTLVNTFWYDPDVGAEWEQREFFVGGVRWKKGRIPQFPIPQPESVLILPLDLALDERYRYRLEGDDTVEGRDCWVVRFDPIDDADRLYKGRVWLDKNTYAKVRLSSLQTGLEPPILTNDETTGFTPLAGPEGLTHWVLSEIEGQQVFSAIGRNLVLFREVTFSNHVINDPGFEALRQKAYDSDRQIVRETVDGERYLKKTADGERVVQEPDVDQLFLLGGVFYDRSVDYPIPLAGVNYFNRDLWGKGLQTNVFFAGAFLLGTLADPDLFGSHFEGNVDLRGQAFWGTDRPVIDGKEREEGNVETISQALTLGIGMPFSDYWKVKWFGRLEYQGFSKDEETQPGFIIPVDTLVASYGMSGEFNKNTWGVSAEMEVSWRDKWEFWGLPVSATPERLVEIDTAKEYVRYQGSVTKNWFLPLNQKIRVVATGYGGTDLDRFSKYSFDTFGNPQRGLSGTGYKYTNGLTAKLQYSFNLGELIRFEASFDYAHTKDRDALDDGFFEFTGFGFSGQTIIGPNLLIGLEWGIALGSDIEEFRGEQEVLMTLLKLFR